VASRATRLSIDPVKTLLSKCDSKKIGYRTFCEALDQAEAFMRLGRVHVGCHLTPYRCAACGDYHLFNRKIEFPSEPEKRETTHER
jgi:hypothetical protein